MSEIKAGLIIASKFVSAGSTVFTGYVDYIGRDEAERNSNVKKFMDKRLFASEARVQGKQNQFDYVDYMGNPEKTTALFNDYSDQLTSKEKQEIKKIFQLSQDNGSIMWQHVISFDMRWMQEKKLYDPEHKVLNEAKMRETARNYVRILQKTEHLETSEWTAAVHWNTDHLHIHIAMVEPVPTRPMIESGMYQGQRRGALKKSSMERAKSAAVNCIVENQAELQLMNTLIRDTMVAGKRNRTLSSDPMFAMGFQEIYKRLPADRRTWKYNMNAMTELRPAIDLLSERYLNLYHPEELKQLHDMMSNIDEEYNRAYGDRKKPASSYRDNKTQDLYTRLGNAILTEMREYDKLEQYSVKNSTLPYSATTKSATAYAYTGYNSYALERSLNYLAYRLQDQTEHWKNKRIFEQMERDTQNQK